MIYFLKSKLLLIKKSSKLFKYRKQNSIGKCSVCGRKSRFLCDKENKKESLYCIYCNAWLRIRYLADILIKTYSGEDAESLSDIIHESDFQSMAIFEAQAVGPIHNLLKKTNDYVCSEYYDNVPSGTFFKGKRCENLQKLSFPDNSLDLILHTSVFEHVRKPKLAIKEQFRVLKPTGILLFEIPMTDINSPNIRRISKSRVDTSANDDKFILAPIYHNDPVHKNGALVYTDWGMDIVKMLEEAGFSVTFHAITIENSSMSHIVVLQCQKN